MIRSIDTNDGLDTAPVDARDFPGFVRWENREGFTRYWFETAEDAEEFSRAWAIAVEEAEG